MFKPTQSVITRRGVEIMNRGTRKGNNLLQLIVGGDDNDEIQTFDEFKEAINGY